LIDACKMYLTEYHVDGFRFDATHTDYMDHRFLLRLADELKRFKPSVLLVAENLPNQADLNRSGFDGLAQWCDTFHDKMKAMLREGVFQDSNFYSTDRLGTIFFFSRDVFATHTNNVVNYCVSHDENSIPFEVGTNPILNNPSTKERKGRLGLISTITALGQPMIYMGTEINQEQERNIVTVHWPSDLGQHGFFQWGRRLIRLRRRYPSLKLHGYNPAETGQFTFIVAPWLDGSHGGGQRAIGWRSRVNALAHEAMVVFLNFENHDVTVDLELGIPGVWVKLADSDFVNDIPPEGSNSANDSTALHSSDGRFGGFVMPSSSGFVYKWEAAV
jgi:1,4-alpha-glucan branching enzyme